MSDFKIEKCKTKAAYSAKLNTNNTLNLNKIKEKFNVILETPVLLVITFENVEFIVHSYGEILFKKCQDKELMTKIAKKVYAIGL